MREPITLGSYELVYHLQKEIKDGKLECVLQNTLLMFSYAESMF